MMKLNSTKGKACIWLLWLLILILAIGSCDKKESNTQKEEVIRPVKIMVVKSASAVVTQGFPAIVRASRRTILSFKVSGPLVRLPVEEGQHVKSGDLIAQIDKRDFLNAIKEAKARYQEANQQFARYKELYARGQVSKADFDRYFAAREVAKAKLEKARNALCDTTLVAPFDGVISKRYVENYYKVKAKEPIVDLQDVSHIELVINVPELIMAAIKEKGSTRVVALFDSITNREFPLQLKEYATEADPATQTYAVVFVMKQPGEANILPGMTAMVKARFVNKKQAKQIIVPAMAVLNAPGNKPYVWVFDKDAGVVHRRFIRVGPLEDSCCIKISDGLSPGEIIVIAGVTKLKDGMRVKPWKNKERYFKTIFP